MEDLQTIVHCFKRLYEAPVVKLIAGLFLWLLKLFFGSSFRPVYSAVILLWLVDFATGYYHARVNPAITPESRRLYHGLVKLAIYLGLLSLGYLCSQAELTTFVRAVIESSIILTEGYSILENLQKIIILKKIDIPGVVPILTGLMNLIQGKLDHNRGGEGNV